jgi:hypothetical protein
MARWKRAFVLIMVIGLSSSVPGTVISVAGGRVYEPITLAQGTKDHFSWAVGVMRGHGEGGDMRPCVIVRVADTHVRPEMAFERTLRTCGPPPASGVPKIVSAPVGDPPSQSTVNVVVYSPRMSSVVLEGEGESEGRSKLKRLSRPQMTRSGVRGLAYGVLVLPYECLVRVTGYRANGGVIYDGPLDGCPQDRPVPSGTR